MRLRIYVGIVVSLLTLIVFVFLGIENRKRREEIEQLKQTIEENEQKAILRHEQQSKSKTIIIEEVLRQESRSAAPAPPLPVCHRGERHPGCRPLAADETGATVRGVRDEIQND